MSSSIRMGSWRSLASRLLSPRQPCTPWVPLQVLPWSEAVKTVVAIHQAVPASLMQGTLHEPPRRSPMGRLAAPGSHRYSCRDSQPGHGSLPLTYHWWSARVLRQPRWSFLQACLLRSPWWSTPGNKMALPYYSNTCVRNNSPNLHPRLPGQT